jgi:hypothetical protein
MGSRRAAEFMTQRRPHVSERWMRSPSVDSTRQSAQCRARGSTPSTLLHRHDRSLIRAAHRPTPNLVQHGLDRRRLNTEV